ncbi:type 4b pilus protein PilO2 [Burkholderia sp. Tr-20390]|uniref:type 4b pilus protein PilO2 n=1 Tax=Burkholderia sp. Tr-20390 TaxID=2703904 RepID=UPI00197EF2B4|nr:type 4b pilus protein PilO2 [Burkholderia sp. Tr-20390]MBN3729340.1 type 4b pilus protein PilO2 [Burkholderia sp. Tr-20390]
MSDLKSKLVPSGLARFRERLTMRGRRARAMQDDDRIALEIEILEFHGRKFVTGLHWAPLTSSLKYKKEAKQMADQWHWDVVAYRRELGGIQAGFVSTTNGAYKRMYSVASTLAGELAKKHGDRWIGLFTVSEGKYLFVAVWDGLIVADTDRILNRSDALGAFNEVLNRYTQGNERFDDDKQFAPAELELTQTELHLEDALSATKLSRDYQLRAISFSLSTAETRKLILLAIIGIVAWQAYAKWSDDQQVKIAQQRAAKKAIDDARLAEANRTARNKLLAQALAHPWAFVPSAREYASACEAVTDSLPLSIAGWLFSSARCDGPKVTITYQRKTGTTQGTFGQNVGQVLLAIGEQQRKPVLGFTESGAEATITVPISAPAAGDDTLLPAFDATSQLLGTLEPANSEALQIISALSISEVPVEIKLPDSPQGASDVQVPQPTWRHYTYKFDSVIKPEAIMASMKLSDGLRISGIETKFSSESGTLTWSFSGDLYVQR